MKKVINIFFVCVLAITTLVLPACSKKQEEKEQTNVVEKTALQDTKEDAGQDISPEKTVAEREAEKLPKDLVVKDVSIDDKNLSALIQNLSSAAVEKPILVSFFMKEEGREFVHIGDSTIAQGLRFAGQGDSTWIYVPVTIPIPDKGAVKVIVNPKNEIPNENTSNNELIRSW